MPKTLTRIQERIGVARIVSERRTLTSTRRTSKINLEVCTQEKDNRKTGGRTCRTLEAWNASKQDQKNIAWGHFDPTGRNANTPVAICEP
jgi:hypothetical protein